MTINESKIHPKDRIVIILVLMLCRFLMTKEWSAGASNTLSDITSMMHGYRPFPTDKHKENSNDGP